jgi:hypothetical protein
LISAVQDKDTADQEYLFSVNNFIDLAELKGKAYHKELEKAAEELFKPFKINQKGKDWDMVNWVKKCKYRHGTGTIAFQVHDDILPLIKNLKKGNYLKYDLENILRLRGEYSIRIYEMLKDEFNKNGRYNRNAETIYTVQYLRDTLEIPKSYRYDNIKQQILLVAQSNLLKYTDIKFDFEIIKLSRAVHSIKFKIYPNLKNIKQEVKLPQHLDNFLSYVNYLRGKYAANFKYFLMGNLKLKGVKKVCRFGINAKKMMYASDVNTNEIIYPNKSESEIIYKTSYLCSLHSDIYRDFIETEQDFYDKEVNDREYYDLIINELNRVLTDNAKQYNEMKNKRG